MLRPRIIPSLLIHDNGLVKTKNFQNPSYVGDPINAVKTFNEKEVDELIVSDIDASILKKEPNFELIKKFAEESRMPLCYSGGIKTVEHVSKIIQLGIEKVGISSKAIEDIGFIEKAAALVGSQSIVGILDIKKGLFGGYSAYTKNGRKKIKNNVSDIILDMQNAGVGEIVINKNNKLGKKIFLYGASTKGNTLLQYYGLTNKDIPYAAERTKTKWGKYTIGSGVKILSEKDARKLKPDYFFVMPYGFINEFIKREKKWIKSGGRFILPYPRFKIVNK